MRRIGFVFALCVAVLATPGLWAQEADLVVPANNPLAASQPVPRLIMFSGTLKDLTGKPLAGPVELNFAIYKEQADAAPLWQESQTLNVDEQGHYTALLGAMQPEGLPVDLFTSGEARWLGVSVGKLPEQPRVLLVSVPYALKANDAEMLAGKPASAYALAQPAGASTSAGSATGGTTGPRGAATSDLASPGKPKSGPKPNLAGTGTLNYIPVWTDSAGTLGNSVIYQSAGLVGVGTATPIVAVDVYGNNAGLRLSGTGTHRVQITGATNGRLGQDAAGFFLSSDTNGAALRFLTNNGSLHEWMRITSAGNVGIGTVNPVYRLDVVGGSARVTNPTGTTQLLVSGSASSGRLGQDAAGFFFSSDTNGAALRFLTNNGSLHEWMRISGAGNVGIGTAAPAHVLDVVGDINASTNIKAGGNLSVTGTISGDGSQLLNLNPVNLNSGVAAIDISGNASTANSANFAEGAGSANSANTANSANFANSAGSANDSSNLNGQPASFYANTGSNSFTGDQTISSGNLNLSQTTSGIAGVVNLGGSPFIHACCAATQHNTFVGTSAGNVTTTGSANTAHGNSALTSLTSGIRNTANGLNALASNTAGGSNTANGAEALLSNSDAVGNTASGDSALSYNCSGVSTGCSGSNNTALGAYAGVTGTSTNANVTGANNTFIGAYSGPGTTTQLTNATAIGAAAVVGQSNTIVLGSINGVNGASSSVSVGIGTQTPAATLQVVGDIRVGTSGTNGCVQNFAGGPLSGLCSSDARLKTNIQPFSPVLAKVVQLQPVHYIWNVAAYPQYHFGPGINSGLIAQEVEKVFPELVAEDGRGFKQVNYGELPYLMLQAIRELKAENDTLRGQVEQLHAKDQKITDLAHQVEELQKVQQQVATLEARLAAMEARTPKP